MKYMIFIGFLDVNHPLVSQILETKTKKKQERLEEVFRLIRASTNTVP